MMIAGGGIGGGAIDGVVNLYVVDDTTRKPISGAAVRVGTIDGTTDATGLFIAVGVTGLTGKQDVVATASGYRSEMWLGANGANMTMDMNVASPVVGQATLSGAITGFPNIPIAAGHAKLAVISYSQDETAPDAANNLKTLSDGNVCVTIDTTTPCNFSVLSRAGKVSLVAMIYDRDLKGTQNDPTDDTQVLIGYATRTGITVVDGHPMTTQDLTVLPVSKTTTETVDFGTPPSGLTAALGVIGIEMSDGSGLLQLPVTTPATTSALVPTLAAFPSSMYRLTAIAQNAATPPTQSIVLRRHQTAATLTSGTWTPPPTNVSVTRTHASWTASAGATVESVAYTVTSSTGAVLMAVLNVTSFDGSTSFDVPSTLSLPTGTLSANVQAITAPGLDPTNFGLDADRDKLVAVAAQPAQVN